MRSLPNVKVFAPGDLIETEILTRKIYEIPGVCYLRLGRGGEKIIHQDKPIINIGEPLKVLAGKDIAILSTGAIFDEVIEVVQKLNSKGIKPSVFTIPTIKPLKEDSIYKIAKEHKFIVTVEEHSVIGGLGSAISEIIAQNNIFHTFVVMVGIKDVYSSVVGTQKFLRDFHGLSSNKIIEIISKKIEEFENER